MLKLREILPKVLGDPAKFMTTVTIDYLELNCLVSEFRMHVEIIESFSLKNIYSSLPFISGLILVVILLCPLLHTTSMKAGWGISIAFMSFIFCISRSNWYWKALALEGISDLVADIFLKQKIT